MTPRDLFLEAVRAQQGKPYIWGAQTPATGFDCSGLVCYGLAEAGIAPRGFDAGADAFYRKATKIEESALRPGDLVFYGKLRCTHVMVADAQEAGGWTVLGAAGGGSKCTTREIAEKKGAGVKRLRLRYRPDVLGFGLLVKD